MSKYDADLDRATPPVQALVCAYDMIESTSPPADGLEGIARGAKAGREDETTSDIDRVWYDFLCQRYAVHMLDDDAHNDCAQVALNLVKLTQRAHDLHLPELHIELHKLTAQVFVTHGVCVDQAQEKAKAEATNPYEQTK